MKFFASPYEWAWAKSVKRDRQVDDRIDRPRQMARATAKPEPEKATNNSDFNDRVAELEADLRNLREEIKRLVEFPQVPSASPVIQPIPSANAPFRRFGPRATDSAGEGPPSQDARINGPVRPLMQNTSQPRQPPTCWDCGLPGHIKRDCPLRNPQNRSVPRQ